MPTSPRKSSLNRTEASPLPTPIPFRRKYTDSDANELIQYWKNGGFTDDPEIDSLVRQLQGGDSGTANIPDPLPPTVGGNIGGYPSTPGADAFGQPFQPANDGFSLGSDVNSGVLAGNIPNWSATPSQGGNLGGYQNTPGAGAFYQPFPTLADGFNGNFGVNGDINSGIYSGNIPNWDANQSIGGNIGGYFNTPGADAFSNPYSPSSDSFSLGPDVGGSPYYGPSPDYSSYNPAPNENVSPTPFDQITSDPNTPGGISGAGGAEFPTDPYAYGGISGAGGANAPSDFNQGQWDSGMWGYDQNGEWTNFGGGNTSQPSETPQPQSPQQQPMDLTGLSVGKLSARPVAPKINPWTTNNSGAFYNPYYDSSSGANPGATSAKGDVNWGGNSAFNGIAPITPSTFNPNTAVDINPDIELSRQLGGMSGGGNFPTIPAGFRIR